MKTGPFLWIIFVASRYAGKGRKKSPSPVLSILEIAAGVLALIVILSVMNGFQLGFIESILEISSYHLRVEGFSAGQTAQIMEHVLAAPGVTAAVPFRELQGLARKKQEDRQTVVLIRGLENGAAEQDAGFASKLVFESGSFDLGDKRNILLGAALAGRLNLKTGDKVNVFSIPELFSPDDNPEETGAQDSFLVKGVFRTGFYDYDAGWAFVPIETAREMGGTDIRLGIKIGDRFQDRKALKQVRERLSALPDAGNFKYSSWRDYNRAFFGALRTEKLFMFILVALIFVVVALNIFQSQRRMALERREEIGLLRAAGAGEKAVRLIFVWDGFIAGFAGAGTGLAAGLLVAGNIGVFFTLLETAANFLIGLLNFFLDFLNMGRAKEFYIFSPVDFYIKEIPSRIIPREVILIYLFGLLSALLAAWFAPAKASRENPAEVLRHE